MKPTTSKRNTSLTAEEAVDLTHFADNEQDPPMPVPAGKKERVDVTPLSNDLAEKIKQMVDRSATSEKTTYAVLSAQGSLIQALENQGLKLKVLASDPSQKMFSINDPKLLIKDTPKILTKSATVKVDSELQNDLQQLIKSHYSNPDVHDELMEVFKKKQQQQIIARDTNLNTNVTIIDVEKRKDKQGNVSRVLMTIDEHGIPYQLLEKENMKDMKLKVGNEINIQGVTMEKIDSLTGESKFAIKPTTQQVSLVTTTQNTNKADASNTSKVDIPVQPESVTPTVAAKAAPADEATQQAPEQQSKATSYGSTIEEVKNKLEFMDFSMNIELSNKLQEQNAEAPSAKFMKLMEINDSKYHVMPSIKRFDSEKEKVGIKPITDLEKMSFANDAEKIAAYTSQIDSRVAFIDKIDNGELDFSPKNLTTTQGFVPTYDINKNANSMRLGTYISSIKGDNVKIEVPNKDSYAVIYGKVNSSGDPAPSKTDHIIVNTGDKVTDSMLFAEVDQNVDKSNLAIVHIPSENIKNVLGKLMAANPKSNVTMIIDNNAHDVDFTAQDSLGRDISSKKAGDVIERIVVEQAINNDKISVVRLNEKFGHSFTNVYEQVLKQVSQNKEINDPKEFSRKALGNVIEASKEEGKKLVEQVRSIADLQLTVTNDKDNTQALEQGNQYKPNRYMKI